MPCVIIKHAWAQGRSHPKAATSDVDNSVVTVFQEKGENNLITVVQVKHAVNLVLYESVTCNYTKKQSSCAGCRQQPIPGSTPWRARSVEWG